MSLQNKRPKELIAMAGEGLLILLVATLMAIFSYKFWSWIFPPEQWYLAPLGFSLTGVAAVVYLGLLILRAGSHLKKTVALAMVVFCLIGELTTVGFGFQIETWAKTGYIPTSKDLDFMKLVVQGLGLVHAVALLVYYFGDRIAEMFSDEDGDGIPNFQDRDYRGRANRSSNSNNRSNNRPPQPAPGRQQFTGGEMLIALGLTVDQAMEKWNGVPYADFAAEVSQRLDISGKNMREIYNEYFSTNGHRVNP